MANDRSKKKRKGDFERKIYELLGVKGFRFLVFKLEKIIHRKDKMKNINYHVKRNNVDSFEDFKKYLYYNGFIHVKNSIALSVTIIIFLILSFNPITITIAILDLIKNLYCIMLQRYNYIGINQYIDAKEKGIQKKVDKRTEEFKKSDDYAKIELLDIDKSTSQLEELKAFLEGREDIIIDESYKDTLLLLQKFLNSNKDITIKNEEEKTKEIPMKRERRK